MEIRGKTIAYSSYKKKQTLLREEKLQEEIRGLERETNLDLKFHEYIPYSLGVMAPTRFTIWN